MKEKIQQKKCKKQQQLKERKKKNNISTGLILIVLILIVIVLGVILIVINKFSQPMYPIFENEDGTKRYIITYDASTKLDNSIILVGELFKDEEILGALLNTVIVAGVSSIVATIVGTAAAIGLANYKKWQKCPQKNEKITLHIVWQYLSKTVT